MKRNLSDLRHGAKRACSLSDKISLLILKCLKTCNISSTWNNQKIEHCIISFHQPSISWIVSMGKVGSLTFGRGVEASIGDGC